MSTRKKSGIRCQVCDDAGHGYHFGVIVCRPCAAFFRRTVALNLTYKCRFDGCCAVNKAMRCMCRACRHKKCLEVGMKSDAVQLNRDSIGSSSQRERLISATQDAASPSSVSSSQRERLTSVNQDVPSPSSMSSCCGVTPSLKNVPSQTTHELIMSRVTHVFDYALLHNDRMRLPSILDEMRRGYLELQGLRLKVHANSRFIELTGTESEEQEEAANKANCETFIRMMLAEIELSARMVTHFRPFMEIPPKERMLFFDRFWPHFLRLERGYTNYITLGADGNEDRVVLYNGVVVNFNTLRSSIAPRNPAKSQAGELKRLFSTSRELYWNYVKAPLKLLKPTEYEFIAMSGHLLWATSGLRGISPQTLQIARDARAEIYSALHQYYVDIVNLPVYAPRIGEFLSLVAAIEKAVAQNKEDVLMADMFDLVQVDRRLLEVFNSQFI